MHKKKNCLQNWKVPTILFKFIFVKNNALQKKSFSFSKILNDTVLKNASGIMPLILGIALAGYGINHLHAAGSKIKSFFGIEYKRGLTFLIIDAV